MSADTENRREVPRKPSADMVKGIIFAVLVLGVLIGIYCFIAADIREGLLHMST